MKISTGTRYLHETRYTAIRVNTLYRNNSFYPPSESHISVEMFSG